MSIELNEIGQWTGKCEQTDCISYVSPINRCHLDGIHIGKNNKCLDYKTKIEDLLDSLMIELTKKKAVGKATVEIDLDTEEASLEYTERKDIDLDEWR